MYYYCYLEFITHQKKAKPLGKDLIVISSSTLNDYQESLAEESIS